MYTCLVTRAIHLEPLQDLSSDEFLMGFRRFISQKGTLIEVTSDNALQFKTASKKLDSIWENVIKCDGVLTHVSKAGVKWTVMVELAPWLGERGRGIL